ncbi:MAG: PQQ-like beta-propeller repeat protein, partial [Planctomycetes bacterium]|nr:PQQ-like beta-propeller repeat protein [Planctomycetota bacterium]
NIKASLKLPANESTLQRLDVPADDLYPYLLRICRKLLSGDDVRDFKYIIRNSGQLLGLREEQVIYSDGKRLVARSILNDKVAWELEPPPRRNFQFATRAGPEGYRVFRHRYGLHRFEPGGETTELTAEGTEAPWAFEVAGEQAAIVNGSSVTLYEANEKMWTYRSPVALTAGPGFTGEHILVGTVTGQLLGLDKNSGKKQWENTLARTLDGPITNVAHMGLCAGGDGQLFAINPANGRMLWQHRLGDIPLRRPVLLASGALLVASMANTIELLDPETGNARAQYEFDTWLMGVEPLKTDDVEMVACSDLTGTVTFLNGSELKPIRQVRLQTRLQGRLFFAPALPPRWGSGKGMFYEEASSLLVSDTQGFVYMLAIPEDRP